MTRKDGSEGVKFSSNPYDNDAEGRKGVMNENPGYKINKNRTI